VTVDLGEIRDLAYYTGVTFQILAPGPGEPVGAGGRYDRLLERFGAPRPAAGFAVALDNLRWALGQSAFSGRARVLVASNGAESDAVCAALRASGIAAVAAPAADAHAYAAAWRFGYVLELGASGIRLCPVGGGGASELAAHDADAVGREVSELLGSLDPDPLAPSGGRGSP
jgi:ATP phosphoribosyltransferase regulatory subunit